MNEGEQIGNEVELLYSNEFLEHVIKEGNFLETLKYEDCVSYDPSGVSTQWKKSLHPITRDWVFKSSSFHPWSMEEILPHWKPEIFDLDPTIYGLEILETVSPCTIVRHIAQGSIYPPVRRDFVLYETATFDGSDLKCYATSVRHPSKPAVSGTKRIVVHPGMFQWKRNPEGQGTIFTVYYHMNPSASDVDPCDSTALYAVGRYHPNVSVAYKVIYPSDHRDYLMRIQISSQKCILLKLLQIPIDKQPTGDKFEIQFESQVIKGILQISAVGGMMLNAPAQEMGKFFKRYWDNQAGGGSTCTVLETPEDTDSYTERVYYSTWPSPLGGHLDMLFLASNWSNPWITVSLYRSVERASHPTLENTIRCNSLPSGYFLFPVDQGRTACIWMMQIQYPDLKTTAIDDMENMVRLRSLQMTQYLQGVADELRKGIDRSLNTIVGHKLLPKNLGVPDLASFWNPVVHRNVTNPLFGHNMEGLLSKIAKEEKKNLKRRSLDAGEEPRKKLNPKLIEYEVYEEEDSNSLGRNPQAPLNSLAGLPQEIFVTIVKFLDCKSIISLSASCFHFRPLATDSQIWREVYLDSHPEDTFLKKLSSELRNVSINFKTVWIRKEIERKNWKTCKYKCTTLKGHTDAITSLEFVGSDSVVSGSRDSTVRLWNLATGVCEKKFSIESSGAVMTASILGNGTRVIAAFERGALCMWELTSGQAIWLRQFTQMPKGFHFVGNKFFSWNTSVFDLWNLETGMKERSFHGHTSQVCCVKSYKSNVASGCVDSEVKFWDKETGSCLSTYQGQDKVKDISLNQHMLLVGSGSLIKLYDTRNQQCVKEIGRARCHVERLQMDDKRIFMGWSDKVVQYWNWNSELFPQSEDCSLRAEESVTSLWVDHHKVGAGGVNGNISIWDFSSKINL